MDNTSQNTRVHEKLSIALNQWDGRRNLSSSLVGRLEARNSVKKLFSNWFFLSFQFLEFEVRGVRKVTTGITGLWQPSVHSNIAF